MAGTIFGLGLSQRVDVNAKPSVGWLLYLYVQNSSTPVTSYQDTGLTVANPWPLQADGNGMMPQFWLADGSYRARATNADGSLTYFDIPSAQSLGPSSGQAPSGSVDPTAIFQTGDLIWLDQAGTRTGWVRDNARTIGSSTSGATERANSDCQSLFEFLWNAYSNTICPVSSGRGVSALADWTANKTIGMPDKRGYTPGGLDDMGNSAAGRMGSAPVVSGSVTTAGSVIGGNTHTLLLAEAPAHQHAVFVSETAHAHGPTGNASQFMGSGGFQSGASGGTTYGNPFSLTATAVANVKVGSTANGTDNQTASQGGGGAHNVMQLTVLGTFYRKL